MFTVVHGIPNWYIYKYHIFEIMKQVNVDNLSNFFVKDADCTILLNKLFKMWVFCFAWWRLICFEQVFPLPILKPSYKLAELKKTIVGLEINGLFLLKEVATK